MTDDTAEFEPTIINADPVRDHTIADLSRQVSRLRRTVQVRPFITAGIALFVMAFFFLAYYTFVTVPYRQRIHEVERRLDATTTTTVAPQNSPKTTTGAKTRPTESSLRPANSSPGTTSAARATPTTTTSPTTTTAQPASSTTTTTARRACLAGICI